MAVGVLLLGLGFMFAHSSLLTTATQFAAKARGTAMSLVAFSFMVGGAIGTALGGRIIEATSYREFYLIGGVGLVALTLVALVAVPAQPHLEEMPLHAESAGSSRGRPRQRQRLIGRLRPQPRRVSSSNSIRNSSRPAWSRARSR